MNKIGLYFMMLVSISALNAMEENNNRHVESLRSISARTYAASVRGSRDQLDLLPVENYLPTELEQSLDVIDLIELNVIDFLKKTYGVSDDKQTWDQEITTLYSELTRHYCGLSQESKCDGHLLFPLNELSSCTYTREEIELCVNCYLKKPTDKQALTFFIVMLNRATLAHHNNLAKFLIDNCPATVLQDDVPLFEAIRVHNNEIAKYLIEFYERLASQEPDRANALVELINTGFQHGATPFMIAIACSNGEIIEFIFDVLARNGCNIKQFITTQHIFGKTPFAILMTNRLSLLKLLAKRLIKHEVPVEDQFSGVVSADLGYGNPKKIKFVINTAYKCGVDLNVFLNDRNQPGNRPIRTLLMRLVEHGGYAEVKKLIKLTEKYGIVLDDIAQALVIAESQQDSEMVELLKQKFGEK